MQRGASSPNAIDFICIDNFRQEGVVACIPDGNEVAHLSLAEYICVAPARAIVNELPVIC